MFRNFSVFTDSKSSFFYVQFTPDGNKKKKISTRVPINGGLFEGSKITANQAKNIAINVGRRLAEEYCKKLERAKQITIKDFLIKFLEKRKPYITIATYKNNIKAINELCSFIPDANIRPFDELTRQDVSDFVYEMRRHKRHGTVEKHLHGLNPAYNEAFDNGVIKINPFKGIRIPKDLPSEKINKEAFTITEIETLIEKLPENWSRAVRVSYYTFGQRLGDVLSLKWSQIDTVNEIITLTTQKTGTKLELPINQDFLEWILKNKGLPDEHVCGNLYTKKNPSAEFTSLVKAHGFGYVNETDKGTRKKFHSKTFHSIRATVATELARKGTPEKIAMQLVGHESSAVHGAYVKLNSRDLKQAGAQITLFNAEECSALTPHSNILTFKRRLA